ncbi:hypothetical protein HDV01_006495 [Terramyces sp. JEL0728]|nr:hypothetical protein HDV01_006495 [Terramyces sp. JEL0728]
MSNADAPDCPAFATIYRALNGQLTNLTASNCCQWSPRNVNCTTTFDKASEKNISQINQIIFTPKDISVKGGTMSPLLGQLKSLISLQLRFLGLTGQIPPLPQQFAVLLLEGNQLSGPIPNFQFNVTNVAGVTKPFFNITNNQFGKEKVPSNLASVDFSVGLEGSQCPFASNMCASGTVTSCPGVAFSCQSNAVPATGIPAPTATTTPVVDGQSDTLFGVNKNIVYGAGGAIGALFILIIAAVVTLGGRKKAAPQQNSVKAPSVGARSNGNPFPLNGYPPAPPSSNDTPGLNYQSPVMPPQMFSPAVLLGQPGAPVQLTGTSSNEYQATAPRSANYELNPSIPANINLTANYSNIPSAYNLPSHYSNSIGKVCLNCHQSAITHIVSPCNHEVFCTECAELNAEGGIW